MLVLGVVLASTLALANKKLYVYEDPRIDVVEDMLPRANCGACGVAGCRAFAEAVVAGELSPSKCTSNSTEMTHTIAEYLGVEVTVEEKRVARLACAGGNHVAWTRAHYEGMVQTCRAAALAGGGGKECVWGCLGLGECADACTFDAITMSKQGLPVVDVEKCTACGDCVEACPRDLFSIHPISHRLWVACKNQLMGEEAERQCEVACTGCGRCEMDAAPGLVSIVDNLAVVNYEHNGKADPKAIQRCPTGAIVWLDDEGGATKGTAAKRIARERRLPVRV